MMTRQTSSFPESNPGPRPAVSATGERKLLTKMALLGMLCLALVSRSYADGPFTQIDPSAQISGPTFDATNGVWSYSVTSQFQAGTNVIKVLLPDTYTPTKFYQVLYVLSIEPGTGTTYGDGLQTVRATGVHNTYDLICVQPTFTEQPWYADHASDPTKRHESYMNRVVLPLIENQYSATKTVNGRLLMGFSKSGFGAYSLLMRNPAIYGFAASWDAPMLIDYGSSYGIDAAFGSNANFQLYSPKALAQAPPSSLLSQRRLILLGEYLFGTSPNNRFATTPHTTTYHSQLTSANVPHYYDDKLQTLHQWDIGWVRPAAETLVALSRLNGSCGTTLFSTDFERLPSPVSLTSLESAAAAGNWILSAPCSSAVISNYEKTYYGILMSGKQGAPSEFRTMLAAPFRTSRRGTFSFDVATKSGLGTATSLDGHDRDDFLVGLDEHGNELFRLMIAAWTSEGRLGYVDTGGNQHWLGDSTHNIMRNQTYYNTSYMRTVRVDFSPAGMDLYLQGVPLATSVPYNSTAARLCEISFRGQSTYSSIYYDNIIFTAQTPFAAWQQSNWPGVTDPAVIGEAANPSGDGLSNLLKYATGLDPKVPAAQPPTMLQMDAAGLASLRFTRSNDATDVIYAVEASQDLVLWNTIWTDTNSLFDATGTSLPQTVGEDRPTDDSSSRPQFLRLKISKP